MGVQLPCVNSCVSVCVCVCVCVCVFAFVLACICDVHLNDFDRASPPRPPALKCLPHALPLIRFAPISVKGAS